MKKVLLVLLISSICVFGHADVLKRECHFAGKSDSTLIIILNQGLILGAALRPAPNLLFASVLQRPIQEGVEIELTDGTKMVIDTGFFKGPGTVLVNNETLYNCS